MLPTKRIHRLGILSGRLPGEKMQFGISQNLAVACLTTVIFAHGLWAQQTKEQVTVDDVDRTFVVRLPKSYDAQKRYPVVILLHGMNQDADDMPTRKGSSRFIRSPYMDDGMSESGLQNSDR
jgi:predicted peptidase